MLLRAKKSLVYATRRMEAGQEFETKTRNEARILVGIGKAEYVNRIPGDLPPPPESLQQKIGQGSAAPITPRFDNAAAPAAAHPLDHDGDGRPGGSATPEDAGDLAALRGEYFNVLGKRPFNGWDAEVLRQKIAEARAA